MSGTETGGKLAAKTNKERHGEDFYKNIGKAGGLGGKADPKTGKKLKGFALNIERARSAGKTGGSVSRRGKDER